LPKADGWYGQAGLPVVTRRASNANTGSTDLPATSPGSGTTASVAAAVPHAGLTLALLYALAFLVSIDSRMVAPLLPAIANSVNATIPATAFIVTAYALPYGLFQIAYGPLADRFGKVAVVRVAVLLFGAGTLGCGLTYDLPSLLALRIVTGAFAACVFPLTLAYIGDVIPLERRHFTVGNLVAVTSVATAIGPAIGGMVASVLSWRDLFIACGLLTFIPALWLYRVPAAHGVDAGSPGRRGGFLAPFGTVLRNRSALTIDFLVFLEGALTAGLTYLGAYLYDEYGASYGRIGLLMGLYGIGSILMARRVGALARRVGSARMVLLGAALLAASYLMLLGPRHQALFAIAVLLMGIGFVTCHSTLQTCITEAVPGLRGTAVASFAFSLFLGGGAGTAILSALLSVAGYTALLVTCGVGLAFFAIFGSIAISRITSPATQERR
jgi:predicted MFS family arabinose efflux permease